MTIVRPELSRRISVNRIGAGGMEQTIEADAGERAALAKRLRIPAVASFTCRFRLDAPVRNRIAVEGELRAEVTQTCVISLEPFEAAVAERFVLRFVPEGTEEDDADPESPDEVPYAGDAIDLGEAAAEQLALALDPYPRMPGVALPPEIEEAQIALPQGGEQSGEAEGETGRPNPFAALARLRDGSGKGGG